jgi:hypothetical protein
VRFEEPVGHGNTVDGLWRAARAGRLAHAVSFVGRAGVGKFLAAEWLSFGLLCAREIGPPCGICGPCKRLKSGSHPDVFVLDAESEDEETIQVSQIAPRPEDVRANVVEFLALRAMEGGHRIVLVREADRMTTFAQNTLLKTLEEPGAGVLIVLETARPELLLPTVHSRCLRLDLRAPSIAEARAVLAANGRSETDAADFARWCDGAPGAALTLASRGGRAMREIVARRLAGEIETAAAASEFADIDGRFPGRTAAMVARARARAFLDLALAVVADGVRAAAGADVATLAHADLVPQMSGLPMRTLRSRLEQCLRARQDVDLNLAPEAIIERALRALGRSEVQVTP